MTAAMGLNVSLIEDVKVKKRPNQTPRHPDHSDIKALASPSFAVTQALVGLLAQTAWSGLIKTPSLAESLKSMLNCLS